MLVSAFAFGGVPEKAVKKTSVKSDVFVSSDLLDEYRKAPLELEAEGRITHLQLKALIAGIAAFVSNATIVIPQKRLTLCRDVKDNMVLECCLAAKADFLITGDKDLLEIEDLPFNLEIMSPRGFMEAAD